MAGILFGLAFRVVAKSIRPKSAVRDYMIMAAFGFIAIYFTAIFTYPAPYPRSGLGVSMMGLSAYLIFVGIYSSGVSISEDINLRRSIKRSAIEEAKLLVSIGSAQMHQQLEKKILQNASQKVEDMVKAGIQRPH